MKKDHCPHCHTRSGLTEYCTLLLTFEMWPHALIYGLIVVAFAQKLAFDTGYASIFVCLAILPLLFRVINKQACDNCGAEFRSGDEQVETQPTDLV